uniref:NADH dehydrogenase subunit 5 n=1 Tax=Drawida ghilarovi TaxID=994964 RepID=UPI0021B651BB|nr:NADH dehydrogenase subunit 5 [Drawida ghilarovi]UIX22933.1 NADH dehydrogenase subunit 5 [Drawida ghilarovi]UIX22946.1 NADH dehydrogenase subunit 5 [Drawida ghilarovi]
MTLEFKISKLANYILWIIFILLVTPTMFIVMNNKYILIDWNLFSIFSTPVNFSVIMDPIGMVFSCVVILISANVLEFSKLYMKNDLFINRFTVLVMLFVLSMNMLIFFPHFMMLLLGWDGLGIVSFILVIYYQNSKSLGAGMITALTNRIGDVMLLVSIGLTLNQGHWNIMNMWESSMMNIQVILILVAAMTKSAQMPFSSWLPAAMAAPTPVSALVHSSTLVTAGVFILIRFFPFLSSMYWFCPLLLLIAVTTTTMAGISATTECDMKKIIALSTLSQLGVMMSALGLNMVYLSFFHMITHAMFKALLFVCAGALIHSFSHSQDLRWMGNSFIQMPTTSSCLMVANLALCGFPFISGFYSKDLIIESSMFQSNNFFMVIMIISSVMLTSFYSVRFMVATMWSSMNSMPFMVIEETNNLKSPMSILSMMSIISGSLIIWSFPMKQELFILSTPSKLLSIMMIIMGLWTSWIMSSSSIINKSKFMFNVKIHYASCLMWFLVPLSSQFMMKPPMKMSLYSLKLIDQSWLEMMGGLGFNKYMNSLSNSSFIFQSYSPMNMIFISMMFMMMIMSLTY